MSNLLSKKVKADAAGIGDNSRAVDLTSLVERIEGIEQERAELADDVKNIYLEIKLAGFAPKIVRKVIALRKMEAEARAEEGALIDQYMSMLGML